jgi:hypothetical protein
MNAPRAGSFEVRRVGFGEAADLLRESLAPFKAAPLRLIGMFLLLWIPIEVVSDIPTLGLILRQAAAAVAFTGYTVALDAAARADPPDFRHLGVVLGFRRDKLLMLILSGVLPVLFGLAVLWIVWGYEATAAFIHELTQASSHPSANMALDLRVAAYLASLPFTFVAPVWGLYGWSGSRSMGANLVACLVNWRWVLAMTGLLLLVETVLDWLTAQGIEWALLSLLGVIAMQLLSLAWTLVLVRRSLPPA